MSQLSIHESYFQNELEKRARSEEYVASVSDFKNHDGLVHLSSKQLNLVEKAYDYAQQAHTGQQRRTGHSYITHPLAVANILADFRLDYQTICAALLHDVIEDTQVTKSTLSHTFGEPIAEIVDGVSKLSHLFDSHAEAQAQNFYKMALAMSKDIRVILVKLADRLHNMRTIGVMTRQSRKRIAQETLDLYVPLAQRLGIYTVKEQLERLSFEALYPLRADRLERYIARIREDDLELIETVVDTLTSALTEADIEASVDYLKPEPYSLYRSLKGHRLSKEEFMDRFVFRIMVESTEDCYRALGIAHNAYKPMLRSFKDYIAIPKKNGYQSLHTTLIGPRTPRAAALKILIRTQPMNSIADYGFVAAWQSHDSEQLSSLDEDSSTNHLREWIQNLLSLDQSGDATEFLENLKEDLFPDEVFVFTPEGDIVTLPLGSTAIDFAYAVHTEIGNSCVACKIDDQIAPLTTVLESGQRVSIVSVDSARPEPDWLNSVKTVKARSAIRNELRNRDSQEAIVLGGTLIDRTLGAAGTSVSQMDFRRLRRTFKEFKVRRRSELFEQVGRGNLSAQHVAQRLMDEDVEEYDAINVHRTAPVVVKGTDHLGVRYSKCCGPVPGDDIIGQFVPGEGLIIHRTVCGKAKSIPKTDATIPVVWAESPTGEFTTRLEVGITSRMGTIASLASGVNSLGAGITLVDISDRTADLATIRMSITVSDLKHLKRVIKSLDARSDTINVQRFTH